MALLRPSLPLALAHCAASLGAFVVGIALSAGGVGWAWLAGQVLLGFGFLHAFILLHEAGHGTLFGQRRLDLVAGHVAGLLTLLPFWSWQRIHFRHHRFTGWQDLDATTAALVPRPLRRWERIVVDFAWATWVPLFALSYRIQNYWNVPRIAGYVSGPRDLRRIRWNVVILLLVYLAAIAVVGPGRVVELCGLGFLLSLVGQESLILSQHTHVPQRLSEGPEARPFPPEEQEQFTRSLRLPPWLSTLLLHFDAHELHHLYPQVPGYRLRRIDYLPAHEVGWLTWIRAARGMSGTSFLFSNWDRTGVRV